MRRTRFLREEFLWAYDRVYLNWVAAVPMARAILQVGYEDDL